MILNGLLGFYDFVEAALQAWSHDDTINKKAVRKSMGVFLNNVSKMKEER